MISTHFGHDFALYGPFWTFIMCFIIFCLIHGNLYLKYCSTALFITELYTCHGHDALFWGCSIFNSRCRVWQAALFSNSAIEFNRATPQPRTMHAIVVWQCANTRLNQGVRRQYIKFPLKSCWLAFWKAEVKHTAKQEAKPAYVMNKDGCTHIYINYT